MQERREHPRKSVDLPVTVRFPGHHVQTLKMIELSSGGMGFLCPIALEVDAEIEVRFSLPSKHLQHELTFKANVRHLYDVLATPGAPTAYRYVVGVNFMGLQENEQALLDRFLMK